MKCSAVQRELITGSEVTPAAREHLEGCHECRRFAEDLQAFWAVRGLPLETPSLLRERTLDQCRAMLAEKVGGRRQPLRTRCRRVLDSPRFVAATAALSVLIFVVFTVIQTEDTADNNTILFAKLEIYQFVMQNISAALFLPALLTIKTRVGGKQSYAPN